MARLAGRHAAGAPDRERVGGRRAGSRRTLEQRALDDGRLAKLAERTLDAAREAWRDGVERRSLEELIDATLAAATASRKP